MPRTAPHYAALLLVCLLSGCQKGPQTPVQAGIALERSFTMAVRAVNTAYDRKLITIDDKRDVAPAVNAGNLILDELAMLIGDGSQPIDGDAFRSIAERLTPYLERVLEKGLGERRPATRPATRPVADPLAPQ